MPSVPIDHFTILGQPRRPWIPAEDLKETFHRATAVHHPDKTGSQQASADLNAAYATLRDPAARLRHLLELEHPAALERKAEITPKLAETFLRLATLRRAGDAFVEQQSGAGSPLGQALLASERFALQRDAEKELHLLETAHARCLDSVQELDEVWPQRSDQTVTAAAELQQELSYIAKWTWQLRELLFRLNT